MERKIIIYVKNNCPSCKMAIRRLRDANCLDEFITVKNIDEDPATLKEALKCKERLGLSSAPMVVFLDNLNNSFCGFDVKKLDALVETLKG